MRATQVLIVGAGPSGLVLANILAGYGVDHLIVDGKPGPVSESRAALVHVRTLELLDRLGVATRAVARGVPLHEADFRQRGRPVATIRLSHRDSGRPTPFPTPLILEQGETERLLTERLAEFGCGVAWNRTLRELIHSDGGVEAVVTDPDGAEETISARWVVGADGGGSPVRTALGVEFSGRTYDQTGLLADVELDVPPDTHVDDAALRLDLTRGGFVGMFRLPSGRWRLFGAIPPELATPAGSGVVSHEPYARPTSNQLEWWLKEYFVVEARLKRVEWSALFRVHSRLAERFQVGNVFLVGDAAHLHSPASGQGMNLGIGDAVNLGWKLALVATRRARASLLASYQAERLPVAKTVLRGTDRGFALEATASPIAVWVRAHIVPHLMQPLLRLPRVQDAIFGLFSQNWIRYRSSPALSDHRFRGRLQPGDRAPYGAIDAGDASMFRHDVLIFEGPASLPALGTYRREVENLVAQYAVDVAVHVIPSSARELHRVYGAAKPCVFLIRPDGHVAHASSLADWGTLTSYLDKVYVRHTPEKPR